MWFASDAPPSTFTGGRQLNAAADAQVQAWLADRGLASAAGWALCYSSLNGDDKSNADAWHAQCDGHSRTVVVGRNSHEYLFGAYSGRAWDDGFGFQTEDAGQFLFRLAGP